MDATAIQSIADLAVSAASANDVNNNVDAVVIPKTASIESLEKFRAAPSHFRGAFTTTIIGEFIAYINAHANASSAVFIDPVVMHAKCIIDQGSPSDPQWGWHRANAELKKTPECYAVFQSNCRTLDQQDLIDFAEDWEDFMGFYDQNGQGIPFRKAINILRRVKLNATASTDQVIENYAGSRSTLEQVEVRSGADLLPAGFTFTVAPYQGFAVRELNCHLRAVTDDKAVKFKYRIIGLDITIANIAAEFGQMINDACNARFPVYLGEMKYQ